MSSSARVGYDVGVAAQGFRTPFSSPNGEQQGGFGVDKPPPVLARRVGCPRLRGLRGRRPQGACHWRVEVAAYLFMYDLLAPATLGEHLAVVRRGLKVAGGVVQPWHIHNWFWGGARGGAWAVVPRVT